MLVIRCKNCNTELVGHPTKARSCGCPNITMIINDRISANDLSLVEIISGNHSNKTQNNTFLTQEDLAFHEARKNRKIRKLEFEIR